jgi:hypothetical protein
VHHQGSFQAEGHSSFRRHADFFAAGKELGKRTAAGSRQRANTGSLASAKNSAHQGANARASAGKLGRAMIRTETALIALRHRGSINPVLFAVDVYGVEIQY